jgi:hypothetical protein
MNKFETLLAMGYFPRELPPPFVSRSLANAATKLESVLAFEINQTHDNVLVAPFVSYATTHNLARTGSLRRKLSVPNPVNYYQLCSAIVQNWAFLFSKSQSDWSLSQPTYKSLGRAIGARYGFHYTEPSRIFTRATKTHVLFADIVQFYPSVYTHSIAWALHTKSVAKANHSLNLVGNLLDTLVRNGQDRQTVGIPIGPDTSLLIAEIILSRIDEHLKNAIADIRGFRYVDDMEFAFDSIDDAYRALAHLQGGLNDYQLSLNNSKTFIATLPQSLEARWVATLRDHRIRPTRQGQRIDLITLFDKAFSLRKTDPDQSILRYAIKRLNSTIIDPKNWPLYESLLVQCMRVEAGTLPHAINEIAKYKLQGYRIKSTLLQQAFQNAIRDHALIGHGSEVAWALWGAMVLDIRLNADAGNHVTDMSDNFVALLALDAIARGILPAGTTTKKWRACMTGAELRTENWLLAYEAIVKNWLPPAAGKDYLTLDVHFGSIKACGVHFYRRRAVEFARKNLALAWPPSDQEATTGASGSSPY